MEQHAARRQLLRYFAASPLISAPAIASSIAALIASAPHKAWAQSYDVLRAAGGKMGDVIDSPSQALNVFDFEPAAKKALAGAPAHFGYLESGVDDDGTLKANREAFEHYTVRVRRLIDARKLDTSVRVFGQTWGSPTALAPVSSLAAFNGEAETAVARGRQAQAPHDSLDGGQHVDRRCDQGAWLPDLVRALTIMQQAGTTTLAQISSQYISRI